MPCVLIAKNTENHYATGMIVDGFPVDTEFSGLVCKRKWVADGNTPESFNRDFVKIICTNADIDNPRIQKLLEAGVNCKRKYRIIPQGVNSPYFQDLYDWAEVAATIEEIEALIEVYNGN